MKSIELSPKIQDLLRQFNELELLVRTECPQERRVALVEAYNRAIDHERDLYTRLYNGDVTAFDDWQAAKKACEDAHARSAACSKLIADRNILANEAQRAFAWEYCAIKV